MGWKYQEGDGRIRMEMEVTGERWTRAWGDGNRDGEKQTGMGICKQGWRGANGNGEMEIGTGRWKQEWGDGKKDGEMQTGMERWE